MADVSRAALTGATSEEWESTGNTAAFLRRQPILDQDDSVVGYELTLEADERLQDGNDIVLLGILASPQIGKLTEHKLTLISLSPASICHPTINYLPTNNFVIAVRPPQPATPQFIKCLRELSARGFRIAVDGVGYRPDTQDLLDAVNYVRLDVGGSTGLRLHRESAELMERSGAHLIAANLQCCEEFELCRSMPFELYQGHYFTHGHDKREVTIDHSRSTVIELLNLARCNAEIRKIEAIFRRDPLLTYRLLRYINSPGCGLVHEIRSIAHALMVLGYNQLYRWLTLLLFGAGGGHRGDAHLTNALVRGRLIELLGHDRLPRPQRDSLFIVGVFSLLDSMLGIPLERALAGIHLPTEVETALIHRQGVFAPYLALALACEQGRRDHLFAAAAACQLDAATVNAIHVEALVWASSIADP